MDYYPCSTCGKDCIGCGDLRTCSISCAATRKMIEAIISKCKRPNLLELAQKVLQKNEKGGKKC